MHFFLSFKHSSKRYDNIKSKILVFKETSDIQKDIYSDKFNNDSTLDVKRQLEMSKPKPDIILSRTKSYQNEVIFIQ